MIQEQIENLLLKLNHDLAGQRRCLDLVNMLLHEGAYNLEDAKKLLTDTIAQFDSIEKMISGVQFNFFIENKPEKGISQI